MRRERIEYLRDLPINIHLASIENYPIYWVDSIQILFALQGSIEVGIESGTYLLNEGEIEVINPNEVCSVKSDDPDNLVLMLNVDPNFFEKYYEDAKDTFFYTNASKDNVEDERYYILARYISILFYETLSKMNDYEDKIEENLLEMMYHLLNNFHYLFYEEESLREDEVGLERYHRIIKYLNNNYMNKVSLQNIADEEFLSTQYLSFKIKDTFGYGFNEFLNKIRVEESIKLLLDSDKNLTEISEEVGFSHPRYYNKHFKLLYNITPNQYRQEYKLEAEELEELKRIKFFNIEKALPYLKEYLEDYERFDYDHKIEKIEIDLDRVEGSKFQRPNIIDLGDIALLLEEENRRLLEETQKEIGFKYCLVRQLFSADMDIYRGKNHRFINWTRVENILDFIRSVKLTPIINTQGIESHIINDFITNFSNVYEKDVEEWLDYKVKDKDMYFPEEEIHHIQDTMFMAPYIIYSYTHLNNRIVLKLIDEIHKEIELDNDTFFGGNGIYTNNYLNKPSYYALMLLSQLGEEIVQRDNGYIVTKSELGYQILIFNPIGIDKNTIYKEKTNDKLSERKISINLFNMPEDVQITRYDLNKSFGSVFDKWEHLGSPERIDNEYWELLKEYVHPNISFYHGKKSTVFNILTTVKSKGAVLFILNNVGKE